RPPPSAGSAARAPPVRARARPAVPGAGYGPAPRLRPRAPAPRRPSRPPSPRRARWRPRARGPSRFLLAPPAERPPPRRERQAAGPGGAGRDPSLGLRDDLEAQRQGVSPQGFWELLAPLGDQHAALDLLVEPEPIHVARLEAVEVEMEQEPVPAILVEQRERRAAHAGAGVEAAREAGDEAGLARAERAREEDHVAGGQRRSERFAQRLGAALRRREASVGFRRRSPAHRLHGRRGVSVMSGRTISSTEIPPCWNEPRNWRSYSWKCVG